MKVRRSRVVRVAAGVAALGVLALPAASAAGTGLPPVSGRHVILDFRPHHAGTRSLAVTAGTTSVTRFTRTVTDGSSSFKVTMVGKNPFVAQTTPSTTIKAFVIPLKVVLPNGDTFDPAVASTCDTAASAQTRVLQSPVVVSRAYSLGGTAEGTGQLLGRAIGGTLSSTGGPGGLLASYVLFAIVLTAAAGTARRTASRRIISEQSP